MAIKRCESSIDVVKAAKIRIRNVFQNGLPVYMSFSGGKDSLCMAQLVMELVQAGEINPAQLTVQFIDEEAIFPCMEDKVKEWRKKFMLIGAKFEWYCLEVKHYNCFNELSNDETFICWDRYKKDVWVRQPPSFAIRNHPLLRPRIDAYQDFLPRICSGGITITGIRTAESVQRLQNIATMLKAGKTMTNKHQVFPIYDWTNNDVWLYLLREKVDIPEIYLFLWQSGTRKGQLRVSQFFSIDTAKSLGSIPEDTELQLMEQIQLFSIRERRILKAINKYREQKGEVAVMDVNRSESKRSFKDQEEEAEYDRRQKEKVDNKEILPGKSYNIATHTANKDMIIARLEQELSTVQSKKTKAIEALSKYRIEKARLESESAGNDAVDDWIAAVLGEEVSEDE